MAINPSTNPTMAGRITAVDLDYPYGSAKDETAPGAGDGSPYFKARADDLFGVMQALLRLASIVPTGNADTARASQYVQGMVELAAGRAVNYDESGGVADVYVLDLRASQQGPAGYFDGMVTVFIPGNANTGGGATANVAGLGVKNIKLPDGTDPALGQIAGQTRLEYDLANDWLELDQSGITKTSVITVSDAAWVPSAGVKSIEFIVVGAGGGSGGVDGQGASTSAVSAGAGAGATSIKSTSIIDASYNITIGAAGTAGAAGANAGTNGGDTTVVSASLSLSGGGGQGTNGETAVAGFVSRGGGVGGPASGGDINTQGGDGANATVIGGEAVSTTFGGGSSLGGLQRGPFSNSIGIDAPSFGGGASGARVRAATDNFAGGAGGAGLVIIKEFF